MHLVRRTLTLGLTRTSKSSLVPPLTPTCVPLVQTAVPTCSIHVSSRRNLAEVKDVTHFDDCQSYLKHAFDLTPPEKTDWDAIAGNVVGTLPAFPVREHVTASGIKKRRSFSKPVAPSGLDRFIYTACLSLNDLPRALSYYQHSKASGSRISPFNLMTLLKTVSRAEPHVVDGIDQDVLDEVIEQAEAFKAPSKSLQEEFRAATQQAVAKMEDWRRIYERPDFWDVERTAEQSFSTAVLNMVQRALLENEWGMVWKLLRHPHFARCHLVGRDLTENSSEGINEIFQEILQLLKEKDPASRVEQLRNMFEYCREHYTELDYETERLLKAVCYMTPGVQFARLTVDKL